MNSTLHWHITQPATTQLQTAIDNHTPPPPGAPPQSLSSHSLHMLSADGSHPHMHGWGFQYTHVHTHYTQTETQQTHTNRNTTDTHRQSHKHMYTHTHTRRYSTNFRPCKKLKTSWRTVHDHLKRGLCKCLVCFHVHIPQQHPQTWSNHKNGISWCSVHWRCVPSKQWRGDHLWGTHMHTDRHNTYLPPSFCCTRTEVHGSHHVRTDSLRTSLADR